MLETQMTLSCFTAYDVRGRLGQQLTPAIATRIARALAEVLRARRVVLGRDCRASSEELSDAVADGLLAAGVEVVDIGLCGTEEVYFGTAHLDADGGICVTASHNPMDYNGMKLVQRGAAPIGPETGLKAVKTLAESGAFADPKPGGRRVEASDLRAAYVDKVLEFVDIGALRPLHILVNAGNGAAGPSFDAIADALATRGAPLSFTRLHHDPDGSFPNGIPNPLLPENQPVTAEAVRAHGADMGVAWDSDFDRCFLFDHEGSFVPGEYVVGLLAEAFLSRAPGEKIVHDPRVIWNTRDVVQHAGGQAVAARTGHAPMKQAMRDSGAIYGGEMSAHHYFRDFMYCDSGMIPWLLVAGLLSQRRTPLKALIDGRRGAFPSSGEINFRVRSTAEAIAHVAEVYGPIAERREDLDGLSLSFGEWRFNLRGSNTEPLLRLNVEARGDAALVERKVAELSDVITSNSQAV